jgi:hypothetical protein
MTIQQLIFLFSSLRVVVQNQDESLFAVEKWQFDRRSTVNIKRNEKL